MILLNGKETANAIKQDIAAKVKEMVERGERAPHLVAIIVGEEEIKNNTCNIKNTFTKEQVTISLDDLCKFLNKELNKGSIVEFTIGSKYLNESLPTVIQSLKDSNYSLVTINDLIKTTTTIIIT